MINFPVFHDIRWTSQKIAKYFDLIQPLVYVRTSALKPFRYRKLADPNAEYQVGLDVDCSGWSLVQPHSCWGEPNTNFILRTAFQIPGDWEQDRGTALFLPIGTAGEFSHPEALVFLNGTPIGACDRHHQELPLPNQLTSKDEFLLELIGWTGTKGFGREVSLHMGEPALVQIHSPTRDFLALARVALGIADNLDDNNPTRHHLYTALNDAFNALDMREPINDNFYNSVPTAYNSLRDGINKAGSPLDVQITAVGHAHIDLAWLWSLAQSRHKARRTFNNVIGLMEQFPEFHFVQSQAQLYEYIRQDDPGLFNDISNMIDAGRWEAIGGMWVEADCNLSGAEALARQFLLGDKFFREHFGEDSFTRVLWLPDVFGFPWSLPQLALQTGIKYFFTIKLGWSQYNRIPYDSFWWQGIDGTRLLTHFSTTIEKGASHASTYNAKATPYEALSTWRNFQQKDWGKPGQVPPLLMVYGHGDGGGGPTREMLENIRLMGDFPATPSVTPGRVGNFFKKLEGDMGEVLPVWNGELYLEYHRGTYTTQARNKRANRKAEFLLHDIEFLAVVASTLDADYVYPYERLQRAWELLCLNQFHDILPGSSIGEVYKQSLAQYDEVFAIGGMIREGALSSLSKHLGGDVLVVNPTSFNRCDLAFWKGELSKGVVLNRDDGSQVSVQSVEDGLLLELGELPAYSITSLTMIKKPVEQSGRIQTDDGLSVSEDHLENDFLRVELNPNGEIMRIYDKRNRREVLPHGAIANQFQAFEDRPKTPDAWEVDIYFEDKMWLAENVESINVVERGPLRVVVEIRRRILNSRITQRVSLAHNSARLDFDTTINWCERHILLKTAFPVDVLSPTATYDIQWGSIERPTHRNTSWDWAKFEVPAHKWVDISEGGYGVSLLNDCKYGYDVHENVIRITLLRGSTHPDPAADLGEHHLVYSLLPHKSDSLQTTIAEAYQLNDPLITWTADYSGKEIISHDLTFITVDRPNVVIETIKKAEDDVGYIVRLYESQRRRVTCTLQTVFKLKRAWQTNLLEVNQEQLEVQGRNVSVYLQPFQIVTLRLLPDIQ
ncbi:MAG: alpha-mannosidase [Chloroflexota bacterium]|nr:alpha-mannosidase [Chloroflexota bacterium]